MLSALAVCSRLTVLASALRHAAIPCPYDRGQHLSPILGRWGEVLTKSRAGFEMRVSLLGTCPWLISLVDSKPPFCSMSFPDYGFMVRVDNPGHQRCSDRGFITATQEVLCKPNR